jgi:MFS family permease
MMVLAVKHLSSYVAICSASWTGAMFLWTTPLLVPAVQTALGLTLVEAGALVTVLLTSGGVGLLLANLFMRKTSLRLIAAAGGCAVIGGLAFLGFGSSEPSGLLLAGLVGAGCGLIMSTVDPCAARLRVPERALSVAGATNTVVAAAAFVAIPLTLDHLGARWIFWSHAAMAAVGVPLLLMALPRFRPIRTTRPSADSDTRRALPIATVFLAHTLYSLGMGSYWAFLEAAGFAGGLSAATIGVATSLATILSLAAPIAAAAMGVRFGRAGPLVLGTAAFGVASAFTLIAKGPPAFIVALTLASAGIVFIPGFLGGVLIAFDQTGRSANIATAIGFLLNGAGPALGAVVCARFGLAGLAIVVLALCLGSALLHIWPARLADRLTRAGAPAPRLALEINHVGPTAGTYGAA